MNSSTVLGSIWVTKLMKPHIQKKEEDWKVYLVTRRRDMVFASSPWHQRGLLELLSAPVASAAAGADLRVPGPPVEHLLSALRGSQAGTQSCRNTGHHPGPSPRREA